MNKKFIAELVGVIVLVIGIVGVLIYGNKLDKQQEAYEAWSTTESFEETLNEYVEEHYGSECYADIYKVFDGSVHYDVYTEDGELISTLTSTRLSKLYERTIM